jgi:hypothetical protein
MKYRAIVDIPPNVKVGDIVELRDPPIREFKDKLEPVGDNEEVNVPAEKTAIINPSLDDLKQHLAAEGIEWRDDMTVVELFELIQDADAKKKADAAAAAAAAENPDEGKEGEDADPDNSGAGNAPDRNELKAKATELGITFASNIPTDKLKELIAEAEAKKDAE